MPCAARRVVSQSAEQRDATYACERKLRGEHAQADRLRETRRPCAYNDVLFRTGLGMSTPSAPATRQLTAHSSSDALRSRTRGIPASPTLGIPSPAIQDQASPVRRTGSSGYASTDLVPTIASASCARRFIRATLARWAVPHVADDAEAVGSELTANAISAATQSRGTLPAIILGIYSRPPELIITVWDNGSGSPSQRIPSPDAETGRGLAIVDDLTGHNWGWWPTPRGGGKVVWAALHVSEATPSSDAPVPRQAEL